MTRYTEAHLTNPEGQPIARVLVPPELLANGSIAYNTMKTIAEARRDEHYPGQAIGAALVFACHEGTPDESLSLTKKERDTYFPPTPQYSVQMHGTH